MIFMWSTNGLIGSRLIRWGLDEDCSHFAVGFFENEACAAVIESRGGSGVRVIPMDRFLKKNRVVHTLQCPCGPSEERELFNQIRVDFEGVCYDSRAILFWVWVGFLKKMFGRPLPTKNLLDCTNALYCVEVLECLSDYLESLGIVMNIDYSMLSPHGAFNELVEYAYLRELPC